MILDQAKAWGGKFVNAWSQDNIFAKRFRVWTKTKFWGTFSMSGPGQNFCHIFPSVDEDSTCRGRRWRTTDDFGPSDPPLVKSGHFSFYEQVKSGVCFFLSMDKVKGFCHQFWGSGSGYLGVIGYIF